MFQFIVLAFTAFVGWGIATQPSKTIEAKLFRCEADGGTVYIRCQEECKCPEIYYVKID